VILPYLYHLLRFPNRADFLDMGFGIAARYRRCSSAWAPHLRCCMELQNAAIAEMQSGGAVAVLGSGRMYDLAWDAMVTKFDRIDCYDADPAVASIFTRRKRASRAQRDLRGDLQGDFYCRDITGCIDDWSTQLIDLLRTKPDVTRISSMLHSLIVPPVKLARDYRLVISLNILSQIPIYWRDRAQAALLKYLKLDTDENGRFEPVLQSALDSSCRALEQGHLQLLCASASERVILITDVERMYYKPNISNWSCEPALVSTAIPELREGERWLWHIAPEANEELGYGIIHLVQGLSLKISAS